MVLLLFVIHFRIAPEIGCPFDIVLFQMWLSEHLLILGYILTHNALVILRTC